MSTDSTLDDSSCPARMESVTLRVWLAIVILGLSTFTIVTTELAPIGLLTQLAEGLDKSESMIGLTVTFYAWFAALSALIASIFLGNLPKKRMLIISMGIICISNVLCALSDNFAFLLIARIIGALAHGAFWAMIGVFAVSLVPPKFIGLATSIVFGGVSAASVFGVPLTNFISINIGWQSAFWIIAVLGLLTLVSIIVCVPNVSTTSSVGTKSLKKVLSNKVLVRIYIATFLTISAHFCAFTFIEPYLHLAPNIQSGFIPIILFSFGIAGLVGNFITGALIDKYLKILIGVSISLIALVLFALGSQEEVLPQAGIMTLFVLWGVAVSGIFVGFQTWILRIAAADAFTASAFYVSVFNSAIGSGALFGAWVAAEYDLTTLMTLSGMAIATSLLLIAWAPSKETIDITGLEGAA